MADKASPHQERRQTVLSDSDIERISTAFDHKIQGLFEVIGYDTTTPTTRDEIRKDHGFVRDMREAKGRIITVFLAGIVTAATGWIYALMTGKHP